MDSVKIGWKKQFPDEVKFSSNRQHLQQHSIQKSKNQGKKLNKKTVHFNCHAPSTKQQAFENTKYNPSRTVPSNRLIFEDHDLGSSSINILPTDAPIIDHKPIYSVRATVITFILVILIILAAAIAAGTAVGMTTSQQSSSGIKTGNNNQNSLSTISTTVVVSSVSIGSQTGAPCTSYTTINDPTRSVNQTGIYSTCDRGSLFNASNGGSWIRFIGTGGTIIPLQSPGMNHCGGFISGWFNDTLPTIVGTVTNGTVCFDINSYSCLFVLSIPVINCGGFYIYFLPPMSICNARYCTT